MKLAVVVTLCLIQLQVLAVKVFLMGGAVANN